MRTNRATCVFGGVLISAALLACGGDETSAPSPAGASGASGKAGLGGRAGAAGVASGGASGTAGKASAAGKGGGAGTGASANGGTGGTAGKGGGTTTGGTGGGGGAAGKGGATGGKGGTASGGAGTSSGGAGKAGANAAGSAGASAGEGGNGGDAGGGGNPAGGNGGSDAGGAAGEAGSDAGGAAGNTGSAGEASGGGGQAGSGTGDAPTIGEISLPGPAGSLQIRQGHQSRPVVVAGTDLDAVKTAQCAGQPAPILEQTSTSLKIACTVPHGAPVGPTTIVLSSSFGEVSAAGIEVTKITAIGGAPDDTDGTPDNPFGSMGRALEVSGAGDTIYLEGGFADRESFTDKDTPNVPAGVSIEGEDPGSNDPKTEISCVFKPTAYPFVPAGDFSLKLVRLADCPVGVLAKTGNVTLQSVAILDAGVGVVAAGNVQLTLKGVSIEGTPQSAFGLQLKDTANVTGEDVYIARFPVAAIEAESGSLALGGAFLDGAGSGATGRGLSLSGTAKVSLLGSSVDDFNGPGIYAVGTGSLLLEDTQVYNNGVANPSNDVEGAGVFAGEAVTLTARGGTFYGNARHGVRVTTTGDVSLEKLKILGNEGDAIRTSSPLGKLTILGTSIESSGASGLRVTGASAQQVTVGGTADGVQTSISATGITKVPGVDTAGIYLDATAATLRLSGATLSDNEVGLFVGGGDAVDVDVQAVSFRVQRSHAVRLVSRSPKIVLGGLPNQGANKRGLTFFGNTLAGVQLADVRTGSVAPEVKVLAEFTDGFGDPPRTYTNLHAVAPAVASKATDWSITGGAGRLYFP